VHACYKDDRNFGIVHFDFSSKPKRSKSGIIISVDMDQSAHRNSGKSCVFIQHWKRPGFVPFCPSYRKLGDARIPYCPNNQF
jgi:hypothetical protein